MKRGRPPKHKRDEMIAWQFHNRRRKGWTTKAAVEMLSKRFKLQPERVTAIVMCETSVATFLRALPKILLFRLSKCGAAVPQKRRPGPPRRPTFLDSAHTPVAVWEDVEPPLS